MKLPVVVAAVAVLALLSSVVRGDVKMRVMREDGRKADSRRALQGLLMHPSWFSLLLFGASFVFFLTSMTRDINPYDEGIIAYGAARVLSGSTPYRDFWSNYGPAQYYVLAGLFKAFGTSILVERFWDLAVRSGIAVLVFLHVRQLASRFYAVLAFLIAVLWLAGYDFHGFPVFPALLFTLGSTYALFDALGGGRLDRMLFLGGLCVGTATLFRHDLGFLTFVVEALILYVRTLTGHNHDGSTRTRLVDAARRLGPYVLGVAVVLIPALGLLLRAVPLEDLLRPLIIYPATIYPRVRSLPFPDFPNPLRVIDGTTTAASALEAALIYFPLLVAGAALIVLAVGASRRQRTVHERSRTAEWCILLFAALNLALYVKGVVRVSLLHLAPAFIPSLILVFLFLHGVRGTARFTRVTVAAFAVLMAMLLAIKPLTDDARKIAANFGLSRHHLSFKDLVKIPDRLRSLCQVPHGIERARCFAVNEEQAATIRYVSEHVRPDQTIYVGSSRHDRLFASDVMFYFLVARDAATKYYDLIPGLQTTLPIQEAMIRHLREHEVPLIVLWSRWDQIQEPNASAESSGVTVLDTFIRDNYRMVKQFGDYTIWQMLVHRRHTA